MNNSPGGAWLSQIESARSIRDLLAIVRRYLDTMIAEEAAELPRGCTSDNVSTAAEIQEWAVALAQEDLKGSGDGALHAAATVFTAAAARVPKVGE